MAPPFLHTEYNEDTTMVNVCVLRSGPRGNSTLIWNQDTAILIDCGLGPRTTGEALEKQGLSMAGLSGVLITHSHGDHAHPRTIERLIENKVPVYCPRGARKVISGRLMKNPGKWLRPFPATVFRIGSLKIKPFEVIHDAEGGSAGFCVYDGTGEKAYKISLATDLSASTKRLQERLKDSHILLLSSNHDPEMLRRDEKIPEHTKESHIIGCHMSNHECAALIERVVRASRIKPEFIYLLHISPNINTTGKALARSRTGLRKAGHARIAVRPTYTRKAGRTASLKTFSD
jgi:phosphoribosyl 1,2-cyclic phosphodiesterase